MNGNSEMIPLLERFLADRQSVQDEQLEQLRVYFVTDEGRAGIEAWLAERWAHPRQADGPEVDFDMLYRRIERRMRCPERRLRWTASMTRVAAVLFIPVVAALSYLLLSEPRAVLTQGVPTVQEYFSPAGVRSKILLPDSTQVWLNCGSRLVLHDDFGRGSRSVELTGEAYFDVTKKSGMPFLVNTPDMRIRVMGTKFNVSAYPDSRTLQAVLVSGAIRVVCPGRRGSVDMTPDQMISLDRADGKTTLTEHVNTTVHTAWIDNQLVFEDASMEEVVRRLERWFNVRITLKNDYLKRYTFTGAFDNRSLERILLYLSQSSPVTYSIDEDEITIDLKH